MKKHHKNNWEDRIGDRLKEHEAAPDDKLWAGIEKEIHPSRPWYAWGAVLIFFLLSLSWFLIDRLEVKSEGAYPEKEVVHSIHEKQDQSDKSNSILATDEKRNSAGENTRAKKNGVKPEQEKASLAEKGELGNDHKEGISVGGSGNRRIGNSLIKQIHPGKKQAIPLSKVMQEEERWREQGMADFGKPQWLYLKRKGLFLFAFEELNIKVKKLSVKNETSFKPELIKKKRLPIEAWATFNPMLTYRQVKPNIEDNIQIVSLDKRSPFSVDRAGFQTSSGVSYFVTPQLALKGGLFYRFTQDKWSYTYLNGSPDSVQLVSLDEGAVQVQPFFEERVQNLEGKHHLLGFLAGLQYSAGKNLRRNLNLDFQAAKDLKSAGVFYFLSFDLEVEKSLGNHFLLYAGPSFMWGLNRSSAADYSSFELKPYSLGLKFGVSYRFRRRGL